jgi:hypothetical protein
MKRSEIKNLIISSLDPDADTGALVRRLEETGISYDFREGFNSRVLDKISGGGMTVNRELDFVRNLNSAFFRVALTGTAAIVLLIISILLMEGSLSVNSFLGLSDSFDESIVYLLTGN